MLELKTLILLLSTQFGRYDELLELFKPHRIYLVTKHEGFYEVEDWKKMRGIIADIGTKYGKEVKEVNVRSFDGKVDFANAFETILEIMRKEQKEKYKVIVAISGGSRFMICAAMIAASITQSEIYYLSHYASRSSKARELTEFRVPIALPERVEQLVLAYLLDQGATLSHITTSVRDLVNDLGVEEILGSTRIDELRKKKSLPWRAASVTVGSALINLKTKAFIDMEKDKRRKKRIKLTTRGRLMAIASKQF